VHRDLAFALELADLADSISLPRFRAHDLVVDTKADLTPVTDADRAVEEALRDRIAAERPKDGVLGEEFGGGGSSGDRWIIDPIDGTKNYSRGIPIYATLIALERDFELTVGVVSAPALGRRWWAARGEGAYGNATRLWVSAVERLEEAVVSFTTGSLRRKDGLELVQRAWHARTFSDFWGHMLVAEGSVDVALDPLVNLWDLAAVKVIVEEAGGRFTDFRGASRPDGGSGVSSNGLLHDLVVGILSRPTPEADR
jgi:histidinol-phosphatase